MTNGLVRRAYRMHTIVVKGGGNKTADATMDPTALPTSGPRAMSSM
jgi:hypothetical protein